MASSRSHALLSVTYIQPPPVSLGDKMRESLGSWSLVTKSRKAVDLKKDGLMLAKLSFPALSGFIEIYMAFREEHQITYYNWAACGDLDFSELIS